MLKLSYSPEIIKELHYERFHHPHPRVQLKMEAIYLRSQNIPCNEVCRLCRITKWTLINYSKAFQNGGIEALKQFNCKGKSSELDNHATSIKESFTKSPPRTASEAAGRIEELTGIKRKLTQVKAFLRRHKYKYRKVGHVPGKACDSKKQIEQRNFLKNKLKPILKEAKKGEKVVFFWMPPISYTEHS